MKDIRLAKLSTRAPKGADKKAGKEKLAKVLAELSELQNLLYAEGKHAVLVLLQGLDASGKDGLIRDVFGALNPQGVSVQSFKVPTPEELSHDFLWRIHRHTPARGHIQVFNRSHYEDALYRYVHLNGETKELAPLLDGINDFERQLERFGDTIILKFYLHVSEEEQAARLAERVSNPTKMWKYNAADFSEAKMRSRYFEAYEMLFDRCSEPAWTVVPADQNWYKALTVAESLRDALLALKMKYPRLPEGTVH